MNNARPLAALLLIGGVLNLGGCVAAEKATTIAVEPPLEHADVYAAVDDRFASAAFFKPREREGLPFEIQMAPLIVQEVSAGDTLPDEDRFGALRPDGSVRVDSPTVYYSMSTAILHGRPFRQITFAWLYRNRPGLGVRMTLDSEGAPLLWEVGDRVYVSNWLNEAASQEFGPPLPGRKYAIEREALVPRVLGDGPVPMGPFVYIRADQGAVSTLLCRCMPSQVDAFVETGYYDLVPADALGDTWGLLFDSRYDDPARLEKCLRLPAFD